MAHASRNARKIRRLKRERTLLLRMAELALGQRDVARKLANMLGTELDKRPPNDPGTTPNTLPVETHE